MAGNVWLVHPIERLRYVARAGSAPDRFLVAESVPGLGGFAHDPRVLLVALKGLITRQSDSPGLLALAAHMTQALEPIEAGWAFADSLTEDQTEQIAETIAIAEAGGTDVIDSIASGQTAGEGGVEVLCPAGTQAWIDHARAAGRSVVVVTPRGSRLPTLLWQRYLVHNDRAPTPAASASGEQASQEHTVNPLPGEHELIGLHTFDDIVGPSGLTPVSSWQPDCPDVAEVARF